MGILGQKSKVKAAPQSLRIEKVVVQQSKPRPQPKPKPRSSLAPNGSLRASSSSGKLSASPRLSPNPRFGNGRPHSTSPYPSSSDERRIAAERKRKAIRSTPRDSPRFGDDTDDSDEDDDDPFHKRRKLVSASRDPNRKLRHKKAFGDESRDTKIIHAADLVSIKTGCPPMFGAADDEVAIELQYPSRCQPERYELVWKKDTIETFKDIIKIVKHVADTHLTDAEAQPFIVGNTSLVRQMERASNENIGDLVAFKSALNNYNEKLLSLVVDGSIPKNLDQKHDLPPDLVDFVLGQVYDRTVAPKAEILNRYRAGSDNVYGELLYAFVRKILHDHANMTSDQVFIDLGSGVGNVVLQAALEVGCRSYGCEMVEHSCDFADAQEKEFRARCLLWGIAPGRVHLERGDFRTNRKILEVLQEADCILVNNKAFTPALNKVLVNMFLDLKPGCKVISLVSFVLGNEKNAINDVANSILEVEQHRYSEGWVSWANSEGDYFVSTRK
ncbi:putative histone H3 methyltransferase [Xylariales sp. AK1849]|nr:putative histone H3 methyltransferase [Xylariales sp. AK1849]